MSAALSRLVDAVVRSAFLAERLATLPLLLAEVVADAQVGVLVLAADRRVRIAVQGLALDAFGGQPLDQFGRAVGADDRDLQRLFDLADRKSTRLNSSH